MILQTKALNQIEAYNQLRYKEEKEKTMKKKIYEYMTMVLRYSWYISYGNGCWCYRG